jgi:hypothetical protein
MNYKRPKWTPETALLLEVADAAGDGITYSRATRGSLAQPLMLAGLVQQVVVGAGLPITAADRLYVTSAGKKAAKLIREAAA